MRRVKRVERSGGGGGGGGGVVGWAERGAEGKFGWPVREEKGRRFLMRIGRGQSGRGVARMDDGCGSSGCGYYGLELLVVAVVGKCADYRLDNYCALFAGNIKVFGDCSVMLRYTAQWLAVSNTSDTITASSHTSSPVVYL